MELYNYPTHYPAYDIMKYCSAINGSTQTRFYFRRSDDPSGQTPPPKRVTEKSSNRESTAGEPDVVGPYLRNKKSVHFI